MFVWCLIVFEKRNLIEKGGNKKGVIYFVDFLNILNCGEIWFLYGRFIWVVFLVFCLEVVEDKMVCLIDWNI